MSVGIFTRLLQYFAKNRAISVQKLGEEKKLSKPVFGYFKTKKEKRKEKRKKCSDGHLAQGGAWPGLAISGGTFFCGFPYASTGC